MKIPAQYFVVYFILSLVPPGLAQSTFDFSNYSPHQGLDSPVFDASGNRIFGSDFVAVLYGGPTVDSLQLADYVAAIPMVPVPFTYIPGNGLTGYFTTPGGYVIIENVPCCGLNPPWLQVKVWDSRLGSIYEAVAALGTGGYGESPLFQARGGDLFGSPPPQPLIGLQSFSLRAEVPEPSTWLLFLLGVPVILFRKGLFR